MRFVIAGCLSVAIAVAVSAQQPPQQQPPRLPDPVPPADLERPSTTSERPADRPEGRHSRRGRSREESRTHRQPRQAGRLLRSEAARRLGHAAGASAGSPAQPERPPSIPWPRTGCDFTNSDLAFKGHHVIMGSYHGFNTYDIERPNKPKLLASVVCPGGQGDVSVHGNLLFMSVEQTRGRLDCGTQGVHDAGERRALPRRPHLRHHRHQQAEAGRRGADVPRLAHAHAGHRSERHGEPLRLRIGHRARSRSGEELAGCSGRTRRTIRTRRSSAST